MSKFFDQWLAGPPQRNTKPSDDTLPSEYTTTPGKAVSSDMGEDEIMRVVPMLCNKAEAHPELRTKLSAVIDELWHLEQSGPEGMLIKRLHEIERQLI